MLDFDPYAVLGVARDASEEEIQAAFRRRAHDAHPDKGGDEVEFARIILARQVLLDPSRRRRFDETGEAEQREADISRAAAIEVISNFVDICANRFLLSNFAPNLDPRRIDLLDHFVKQIEQEIVAQAAEGEKLRRGIEFMEDYSRRFAGADVDFIKRRIEHRIGGARDLIKSVERSIRGRRDALDLARGISFSWDDVASFVHYELAPDFVSRITFGAPA